MPIASSAEHRVGSFLSSERKKTSCLPNERDAKLIQYLSEALGKERELETALQVDIAITTKAPYKKRLRQHLRETKAHRKRSTARRERMPKNAKTQFTSEQEEISTYLALEVSSRNASAA